MFTNNALCPHYYLSMKYSNTSVVHLCQKLDFHFKETFPKQEFLCNFTPNFPPKQDFGKCLVERV